ncbi:type II toxin-antitoxin system RelE/ParE family toxin [Desulfovibrio sp. OttesenSCG-928-M14]|nr:type II toxin-antitoxin system RelE/ParE family toxin [Desulfovibrio sp. OttesenSCG-928-O18]MDL2216927.1 type II toxin-antitoxin system RelE/ParE family toxin [Desulfovibrio sp. OttesenSCG-928-M14]MDL2271425.1 type II toxin-antitoxin system RelE/ParE family toxin [Desulfovibrio sp. OttesenSCG-928-I05]
MRIFKNKWFVRFTRKEGIPDRSLYEAVREIETGNFDADLGAGVFKQRIARPGEGQSGGYRVILCFKAGERTFFIYGFAKSDRDNIAQDETREMKKLAKILFSLTDQQLESMLQNGDFTELP